MTDKKERELVGICKKCGKMKFKVKSYCVTFDTYYDNYVFVPNIKTVCGYKHDWEWVIRVA